MNVHVQIPDDVALMLCRDRTSSEQDLPRAVVEALALEGYRSRRLTESQARRLLGFDTRMQVHAFLKEHDVPLDYSAEDLEKDLQSLASSEGSPAQQAG